MASGTTTARTPSAAPTGTPTVGDGPVLLIDQQEQRPWAFPGRACRTLKLKTGDYSVLGLEDEICIERKSLSDLVGTVIHDWLRFVKELRRMAGMRAAIVVVESTPDRLYAKEYIGDALPQSVMGKCSAITLDYGIPVTWWGSREASQRTAEQWLVLAWEKFG